MVNPTAFLPHHTSQCTSGSGDDAFPTQIPSTNRSLRFRFFRRRLCGNQHQVHQVVECVLVRYRKWVMPLTAKCLQLVLTDTSCPSFSRDVSTIPVHVSARSVRVHVRHRARTSRSTTPSTRVTWTRTQLILFVLRFLPKQVHSAKSYHPQTDNLGRAKKKKRK